MPGIVEAVVSGLIGGIVTGGVALTAIKVHVFYLRRDVDAAHASIKDLYRLHAARE